MGELELIKEIDRIIKLLRNFRKNIKDYENYREDLFNNLYKINDNIRKYKKSLEELKNNSEGLIEHLYKRRDLIKEQYEKDLGDFKRVFGNNLEKQLNEYGLSLKGHYPELRVSYFTLELNFENMIAKLWFGPKQEIIFNNIPLSVPNVLDKILLARNNLGSKLSEKDLLILFKRSFEEIYKNERTRKIPIISFYNKLCEIMADSLSNTNKKSKYSRADFSYDLYRLRKCKGFKLTIAARSYTKKKSDFIWVPNNEEGSGDRFSHIEMLKEDFDGF